MRKEERFAQDLIAYGNYAGHNDNNTTPVQGLQRMVPDLVWEKGCEMATNNTSGFAAAVAAAKEVRRKQLSRSLSLFHVLYYK